VILHSSFSYQIIFLLIQIWRQWRAAQNIFNVALQLIEVEENRLNDYCFRGKKAVIEQMDELIDKNLGMVENLFL